MMENKRFWVWATSSFVPVLMSHVETFVAAPAPELIDKVLKNALKHSKPSSTLKCIDIKGNEKCW